MRRGFTPSRIALFFVGIFISLYSYADENKNKLLFQHESKQIICKTPEEVKRLCAESLQLRRLTPLKAPEKLLLPDYSNIAISGLQSPLSLVHKYAGSPVFRLNMQDERPVIGMGLINQEILRISFLLGTDLDIEQATAEELMQSLTEFELKPNIGVGFEGYW